MLSGAVQGCHVLLELCILSLITWLTLEVWGSCQTCSFCSSYWSASSISPISKTGLYSLMAEGAKYFCKSPAYEHWRKWDRCGIACPCEFSSLSSFSFASPVPFFPQLLGTLSYSHFIPSTLYFVLGMTLRACCINPHNNPFRWYYY